MEQESCKPLPAYYERHLGVIARGWSDKARNDGIQVVSFDGQPERGVTTFATLGLSAHILNQPSGRQVCQELLVSANTDHAESVVAGFLLSLAERVLVRHQALLRGEVIGPATPVIEGSTLTAVYVTNPSPFEDLTKHADELSPIIFTYLIPISISEAALVREQGWKWFEEQLELQNPNIWNLCRTEEIVSSERRP